MTILGVIASSTRQGQSTITGSMEPIAVATVPSGGLSSITFGSIPQTYTHLQLRIFSLMTAADNFYMRFNSDSNGNYAWHQLTGDGSSAGAANNTGTTFMFIGNNNSNSATIGNSSIVDILDYANTNKNKTMRALLGSDANGSGLVALRSGVWLSTSAVSTISIIPSSGSFREYSSFALYGIKGA